MPHLQWVPFSESIPFPRRRDHVPMVWVCVCPAWEHCGLPARLEISVRWLGLFSLFLWSLDWRWGGIELLIPAVFGPCDPCWAMSCQAVLVQLPEGRPCVGGPVRGIAGDTVTLGHVSARVGRGVGWALVGGGWLWRAGLARGYCWRADCTRGGWLKGGGWLGPGGCWVDQGGGVDIPATTLVLLSSPLLEVPRGAPGSCCRCTLGRAAAAGGGAAGRSRGGGGAGRWGVTGLASADSGLAALGFGLSVAVGLPAGVGWGPGGGGHFAGPRIFIRVCIGVVPVVATCWVGACDLHMRRGWGIWSGVILECLFGP